MLVAEIPPGKTTIWLAAEEKSWERHLTLLGQITICLAAEGLLKQPFGLYQMETVYEQKPGW